MYQLRPGDAQSLLNDLEAVGKRNVLLNWSNYYVPFTAASLWKGSLRIDFTVRITDMLLLFKRYKSAPQLVPGGGLRAACLSGKG